MRVLLATGQPKLNEFLAARVPGIEVVGRPVEFREALRDAARRWQPEAAIVAADLQGEMTLPEAVFPLRVRDVRVIVLYGRKPEKVTDPLFAEVSELLAMGVTDIFFSEVDAEEVAKRLANPSSFGTAVRELLRGIKPHGSPLAKLLGRAARAQDEAEDAAGEPAPKQAPAGGKPLVPRLVPRAPTKRLAAQEDPKEQEPAAALQRTSRPSVGFWSPVGAGASTLALSLAWLLSRKEDVCLLDLGEPPAQHALLCLPADDYVRKALGTLPGSRLPEPAGVGRLRVVGPCPGVRIGPADLPRLASPEVSPGDVLVVDLPRAGPVFEACLAALWWVVVVGDPDWQHADALRTGVASLRERGLKVLPVLNRYAEPPGVRGFTPASVFREEPAAVVPAVPAEAYAASVLGQPLAKRCQVVQEALRPLVAAVETPERREAGVAV